MKKISMKKFASLIGFAAVLISVLWFSNLDIRNYVPIGAYVFSDQMRSYSSVFFSLASNRHSVSSPIFSMEDRRFVKYIQNQFTSFTLKPPSRVDFEVAEVEVVFKPLGNTDIDVELGSSDGNYMPKRLYSHALRDGLNGQFFQEYENLVVLQDGEFLKKSDSIKQSFQDVDFATEFSVYTNDLNVKNDAYSFSIEKELDVDIALQGKHSFLTYSDGRPASFEIAYEDVNKKEGPDRINMRVKKNGKILEYIQVQDDGVEDSSGESLGVQRARIELDQNIEGILELELDNSDDVIVRNIASNLQHLAAQGDIVFASGFEDVALYSSDFINVSELSESSSVSLGNASDLVELRIESPEGKIVLDKDELLSFSPESFLDFSRPVFLEREDIAQADVLVVQKHNASKPDRKGWITSSVSFSKDEMESYEGELPFRFVVDGERLFLLDSITVRLK